MRWCDPMLRHDDREYNQLACPRAALIRPQGGRAVYLGRGLGILLVMAAIGAGVAGDRLWQSIDPERLVLPADIQAAASLTPDEEINIRVYRSASPAVANI